MILTALLLTRASGISLRIPWSTTLQNPTQDFGRCGSSTGVHVCDPSHLMSPALTNMLDTKLRSFSRPPHPSGICDGYNVYAMLLSEMDDAYMRKNWDVEAAFRSYATDIGRRAKILNTSCHNGIVVVYSLKDAYVYIRPDDEREKMFPQDMLRHIVRSALAAHAHREPSPEETLRTLITHLTQLFTGVLTLETQRESRSRIFMCLTFGFLVVALVFVIMFAVGCAYDAVGKWMHRARFYYCKAKIQRIHDVCLKTTGDMPLCLICMDFLPSQPWKVVVFLCGHRYHLGCANSLLATLADSQNEQCPACNYRSLTKNRFGDIESTVEDCALATKTNTGSGSDAASTREDSEAGVKCCSVIEGAADDDDVDLKAKTSDESLANDESGNGESKEFMLRSLRSMFPDIISLAQVIRWRSCHTESWLDEVSCPPYIPLLSSFIRQSG